MASFWGPVEIEKVECRLWQYGGLNVWVRLAGDEWYVAMEAGIERENQLEIVSGETVAAPEGAQWERWLGKGVERIVRLSPLMPDRAVVVRPEMPLHIAYGQQEMFFVIIPLWIRVAAGKSKPITLCERPSQILSNTWFGDPTRGELCYSLNTSARIIIEESGSKLLTAVCPVSISNKHKEPLNFERLCVRTEHLSIYESAKGLITNEVRVTYQGEEQMSRIKYGKKPPSMASGGRKVAEPRKPVENNLIRKSFSTFMETLEG